ncbi:hypothetical protein F2Q70_00003664 [Brassica cretica]|uniref:Mitotic spindle checkpoint protein MAD1 n=1 Tax=Brassica cretica TaxID=69181 RepID=A0A8S9IXW5_BRACR|nr:hypothetical protein F2Q70_00003664 [Brassica cretica]
MILRTPPPKKARSEAGGSSTPTGDQLVIYEDSPLPAPLQTASHDHSDQHLCTYQCRQMVKSDVLDALSKAEKQAQGYQTMLQTLNQNFTQADEERKQFRGKFLYSEQELAAAKGREKVLQEQLLMEMNNSQERYTKALQSCHDLEVKLQSEMNLRTKAESSVATAEEKAKLLEEKLSQLSGSVERERNRLNNDIAHLGKEAKLSVSRIGADLERMQCRAQSAETESDLLRSQLEDLKHKFDECLHEKTEVYKKLSSFTSEAASPSDNNVLFKTLLEELKRCEAEVREARKLKSQQLDAELLKVKLLEEKSRRERAESELSKLPELQISFDKLENELCSWKSLLNNIPGVSCPDDVVMKFSALQKEVLDSTMKIGEASTRFNQLEAALDATQLGKQNAETEAALAKEKFEALKSDVKRIEAMLGHGDFSAANTRVLRMVNTLGVENEAKQTIEALQAELQKTKERLQAVEELKSQSGDAGKLVDSHITGKIAQLKEQIATLEKREERYKTVFADRISVFRRACCELFGYKIVMDEHQRPNGIPVTRFTLQSIYAQSDGEKLEFDYESGNTSILDNQYTSQGEIAKQIEIFIRKFNSIPAFTANLTMESFNRRTLY